MKNIHRGADEFDPISGAAGRNQKLPLGDLRNAEVWDQRVLFGDELLTEQPERRGRVTTVLAGGGVMIYSASELFEGKPDDIRAPAPLRVGQYVHFVVDPLTTDGARLVRPE